MEIFMDLLLNPGNTFAQNMMGILANYIIPFVALGAAVWSVWTGIFLAKARNEEERGPAKRRFFMALSSLFIIAVLFIILKGISFAFWGRPFI